MKWLRCLLGKHKWVYGRATSRTVAQALPDRTVFHNRVCTRCLKEDLAADNAEREYDRIASIQHRLGGPVVEAGDISSIISELENPLDDE